MATLLETFLRAGGATRLSGGQECRGRASASSAGAETKTGGGCIAIAVRLARDRAWRTEVKKRIARKKHHLYRDDAAVSVLEKFPLMVTATPLETAVRPLGTVTTNSTEKRS